MYIPKIEDKVNNDMQDRQDKQDNAHIHSELTEII